MTCPAHSIAPSAAPPCNGTASGGPGAVADPTADRPVAGPAAIDAAGRPYLPCPSCAGTGDAIVAEGPHGLDTCVCPSCDGTGALTCADCGDDLQRPFTATTAMVEVDLDIGTFRVPCLTATCAECERDIVAWHERLCQRGLR